MAAKRIPAAVAIALALLLGGCTLPLPVKSEQEAATPTVSHGPAPEGPAIAVEHDFEAVDAFVGEAERLWEELRLPGMSVAVLHRQEVVFAGGFGYADVEAQIPATENTPYPIASLTKPFAAVLIMQLVEAGKLDLDEEMAVLLRDTEFSTVIGTVHGYADLCERVKEKAGDTDSPYVRFYQDYRCDTEPITVRHHLTHTAQGVPGRTFRYNGFLYGLLAGVVIQASGIAFEESLVEQIIIPLEMADTIPCADESQRERVLAALARPYWVDSSGGISPSEYPGDSVDAASGMISTVLDMARFDVAIDEDWLLSPVSREAMFSPALSTEGYALPYGLGWFVQEYEGTALVWHYGWDPAGYSSLMLKIPQHELTLILLANSEGLSASSGLDGGDVLQSPFAAAFVQAFLEGSD